ncbi:MAG: hypothetical protein GDYSWBUE_001472 [Candidatus Fervidibacterota bacterium]
MLLLKVLLAICVGIGLLIIPIGMPGTVVIFIAALIYGIATKFSGISVVALLMQFALCLIAECGDNMLSMLLAKRSGASGRSMVWSILGAIGGGIVGAKLSAVLIALIAFGVPFVIIAPLAIAFVTFAFAILGAFTATFACELLSGKSRPEALAIAKAAIMGRVLGTVLKLGIALAMAAIVISAMF